MKALGSASLGLASLVALCCSCNGGDDARLPSARPLATARAAVAMDTSPALAGVGTSDGLRSEERSARAHALAPPNEDEEAMQAAGVSRALLRPRRQRRGGAALAGQARPRRARGLIRRARDDVPRAAGDGDAPQSVGQHARRRPQPHRAARELAHGDLHQARRAVRHDRARAVRPSPEQQRLPGIRRAVRGAVERRRRGALRPAGAPLADRPPDLRPRAAGRATCTGAARRGRRARERTRPGGAARRRTRTIPAPAPVPAARFRGDAAPARRPRASRPTRRGSTRCAMP